MAQELEAQTARPNTDAAAGGPVTAQGGTAVVGNGGTPLLGGILPPAVAGRLEGLRTFGAPRIAALGLVALAFAAFFAFIINRSLEERYTLLYANLDLAASQEIVQRAGDARRSLPPERRRRRRDGAVQRGAALAHEPRRGGPAGGAGVVGYEIFDSADPFGTTEFLSNVNLKRALEGELARTIASMKGVRSARVHLVQPKRELFQRERTKPSASVFLSLRVPGGIDRREIAAVRHLVAAAVPGLDARGVTVLDDGGNLLAGPRTRGRPATSWTRRTPIAPASKTG